MWITGPLLLGTRSSCLSTVPRRPSEDSRVPLEPHRDRALSVRSAEIGPTFDCRRAYLFGSFGVDAEFNVPCNERLARMEPESREAQEYRPIYVQEWLFWNHVRTGSSLVSAGCAAGALVW